MNQDVVKIIVNSIIYDKIFLKSQGYLNHEGKIYLKRIQKKTHTLIKAGSFSFNTYINSLIHQRFFLDYLLFLYRLFCISYQVLFSFFYQTAFPHLSAQQEK